MVLFGKLFRVSNLMPGTTQVTLPWPCYASNEPDIRSWLLDNVAGRADVFMYEHDDPLDHHHVYAVVDHTDHTAPFAPAYEQLEWWFNEVACDGDSGSMLFAFQDATLATLFKLTFTGTA